MTTHHLHNADCFEVLPTIPDHSIHLVATDLPFCCTSLAWDTPIDLPALWSHYQRVLNPKGAVVLNADIRLAAKLLETAPKSWFRYDLVWDKTATTGYLDSNRRPLRKHELILVFSPVGYPTYNPIMGVGQPYQTRRVKNAEVYGAHEGVTTVNHGSRYPTSIIQVSNANARGKQHPTQKPIKLLENLISTYSNPGDTVLDSCMGSGTAGVAALGIGRSFVGIEKDLEIFNTAKQRIEGISTQ